MSKHKEMAFTPYSGSRYNKDAGDSGSTEVISSEQGDGHEALHVVPRKRYSSGRHDGASCRAENSHEREREEGQVALPQRPVLPYIFSVSDINRNVCLQMFLGVPVDRSGHRSAVVLEVWVLIRSGHTSDSNYNQGVGLRSVLFQGCQQFLVKVITKSVPTGDKTNLLCSLIATYLEPGGFSRPRCPDPS